jgi:hypothetical protein
MKFWNPCYRSENKKSSLLLRLCFYNFQQLNSYKGRRDILERATSQQSFQRIVSDLQNLQQQALVASGEEENSLILAGPGQGKHG